MATAIAWWSLIPQVIRLVKTKDPSGVSSAWPAIGLVTNAGWTAYLLHQQLWAAAPSTAVMTLSYGLVLWALGRTQRSTRSGAAAGAAWAVALAIVWLTAGWNGVGLTLASSYALQFAPAVWTAYRASSPTGISPTTWVSIVVESMLWGAFGYLNGNAPILIYAAIGSLGGTAILLRYRLAVDTSSADASGNVSTKRV